MQNKQIFNKIIQESIYLLILIIISIIALKILFYKENIAIIMRLSLSFFWVFILPGFAIMFYWENKLNFTERLVISVGLSAAIIGITSYYLGLLNVNIKYHVISLPLIVIIIGYFITLKSKLLKKNTD